MTDCDPSSLTDAARCFLGCVPKGAMEAVKSFLLCQWADVGPSTPTLAGCGGGGLPLAYEIDWANGPNPQTGVEIWLNKNGAGYAYVFTRGPVETNYIDNGPYNPGDNVCGKVRAVNGATASSFSAECCFTF